MLPYLPDPAYAIAFGQVPDIDPAVLAKHGVGVDKVIRYVLFHAAHWNATHNQSRVGRKAARDCLRWHGRTIDACHDAAVDAGLIAEVGKRSKGKVTPLAYPWFVPTGERTGDSRDAVDNQRTGEPTGERTGERTGDSRDEQNRTEQGGGRRRKTQPPLVASVATPKDIDEGCPKHGWNDPGDACGGCQKASKRKQEQRPLTVGEQIRQRNSEPCDHGEPRGADACPLCRHGEPTTDPQAPAPKFERKGTFNLGEQWLASKGKSA